MRGLNLSRLARSSEASFFKDRQTSQASELRKKLTPSQVKEAQTAKAQTGSSVDVLPEILAHSASKRIVVASGTSPEVLRQETRTIAARVTDASHASGALVRRSPVRGSPNGDPAILSALGSNRLSVYSRLRKDEEARPLPGSAAYADGAVLGLASFSIASAIVATTGLVGVLYLYFNPRVIDRLKHRTLRLRSWLDEGLGKSIRTRVRQRWEAGPMFSESTLKEATVFARSAVGVKKIATDETANEPQPSSAEAEEQSPLDAKQSGEGEGTMM